MGRKDERKEGNKQSLDDATIDAFKKKYEVILEEGLKIYLCNEEEKERKRGKRKQSKGKNLIDRLMKYKDETLAFMSNFMILFDNNL